jgi:predicted restriction endonuclease
MGIYYDRYRRKIFEHYGLSCKHCGDQTYGFLTIDHLDRSTKKICAASIRGGADFYRWLINNGLPEGFQTLCRNCNFLKYKLTIKRASLRMDLIMISESYRQKVFQHYGEKCACCSISDIRVLTIDHIDPSTKKQKGHLNVGYSIHYWLIKNNFPLGFQTLCHNCNWGKHIYGVCPHQLK